MLSAAIAFSALPASAAIILTGSYDTTSRAFYTPSSTDLINGLTPTTTYVARFEGRPISVLTDGSAGAAFASTSADVVFGGDFNTNGTTSNNGGQAGGVGWSADYTLTGSVTGYDITAFNLYSGHTDTRVNQNFSVFVQTVGSGGSWLQVGSDFAYNPNTGASGNFSAFSSVTENTTGIVFTGVTAVRLQTSQAVTYGATMFREFDVIGTASIPEPSTFAAVLGALAMGLAAHRRRRAC